MAAGDRGFGSDNGLLYWRSIANFDTTGGVLGYVLWAIVHACRKKRED